MFPGMGKMNPAQMKRMMGQLGIKSEELDAKKVIFELENGRLVIDEPSVSVIDMQGQKTYTVMGEAREEAGGAPEADIKMVAEGAGASEEEAEKALEETGGDIAEAIAKLKK